MSNRFLLFGEKPFDDFALERFSAAAASIERLSDIETVMYKDSFDELVQKTVSNFSFRDVEVSFENKVVDLVNHPLFNQPRYFAEYSLVVKGNPYYLGLIPYHGNFRPAELPVELNGDVLSFEIDTGFHCEELPEDAMNKVKHEYLAVKKFIEDSLYNLRRTIVYYNSELEKFVIPLLANRLRKADRHMKIREALNFK